VYVCVVWAWPEGTERMLGEGPSLARASARVGLDDLTLEFISIFSICIGGVGLRPLVRQEGPGLDQQVQWECLEWKASDLGSSVGPLCEPWSVFAPLGLCFHLRKKREE
jgi:hypothetical protein